MADQTRFHRIQIIQNQIDDHPAKAAWDEWQRLLSVYAAFIGNSNELITLLRAPQKDPKLIFDVLNPAAPRGPQLKYQDEIFRMLINYCATASTLIDHTRTLLEPYFKIDPNFEAEYQDKKKDILELPATGFVHDLRNYLLHRRLPSMSMSTSYRSDETGISFAFMLDRGSLTQWDGWKSGAKTFMNDRDTFTLLEPVNLYSVAIEEHYQWLFPRVLEVRAEEFQNLLDLQWVLHQEIRPPE